MTTSSSDTTSALTAALLDARRADGAWGYYAGDHSRLEPTCWSVLALLGTVDSRPHVDTAATAAFLTRSQRDDGLLVDAHDLPPNLAVNGLVAVLVTHHPELLDPGARARLVEALRLARGIQLPQYPEFRQDNSLQGWSWVDGTFSWMEPTAWCLLALKRATDRSDTSATRIDEAERLLFDRVCQSGGWNYGNAYVLDKALHPYVPTTALGLLALQDRRDHDVVHQSLAYLEAEQLSEASGTALGLTGLCLRIYGRPTAAVEQLLHESFTGTAFLGNAAVQGLALYALTANEHDAAAFRIS